MIALKLMKLLQKFFKNNEKLNANEVAICTDEVNNKYKALDAYLDNINNYSTEEIIIGKWEDGKPIYRKVIYISNLALSDGVIYPHGIKNINEILPMTCGRMLYGNNKPYYKYPLVSHSGAILDATFDATNISWVGNDNWGTSHTHIFVIYYTKTVD